MKLLIKDLELKLDKKIKRNHSSIGVDTATLTGVGFINTDDKEITIEWSLLSFEAPSTNNYIN